MRYLKSLGRTIRHSQWTAVHSAAWRKHVELDDLVESAELFVFLLIRYGNQAFHGRDLLHLLPGITGDQLIDPVAPRIKVFDLSNASSI